LVSFVTGGGTAGSSVANLSARKPARRAAASFSPHGHAAEPVGGYNEASRGISAAVSCLEDPEMSGGLGDAGPWLEAARAGSLTALGEALEACRAYLLLIAQQEIDPELRAKGGASDLVQETFLEAQRDFAHFQGTTQQELLAWLRRLLLNNLANFVRHHRQTAKRRLGREVALQANDSSSGLAGVLTADLPSPSDEAVAQEETEAVQQAVLRLPDDYRQVILLRYQQDRSFEEIGRIMSRSTNAARRLWLRALERLEQELDDLP
jgi:RNA polymerase sigma-70 factor (ECF subfamily)